ncbi:MAG: nitroreductase family deazaflavin-dependent oxidoreductase [Gammaproteobacteria bacterium]|nr:nitroreductase family deazaflavin-dependent oxidoreductase [Gammaproteobacteria bacterium]
MSGEVVATPSDWRFVNDTQEVFIETATEYGIAHSVTVVIAEHDGNVFVPSIYEEDIPFPGHKYWNSNIARDPNVRVKIGDSVYEMTARPANTDEERQEGLEALAAKYDFWKKVRDDPANARRLRLSG